MSELELRKLKELIAEVEAKEGKKVVIQDGKVKLIEVKTKLSVKMGLPAIHYLNSPAFSDCVLLLKKVPYCGDYSRIYDFPSDRDDVECCPKDASTVTTNNAEYSGKESDFASCTNTEKSDELMVIPAHTSYLTLRSKFFENLFCSSFQESESRVVNLSEISFPEVFLEVLLPFLYTGVLAMKYLQGKEDKFLEMVAMADYFDLDQAFEDQCRSFFEENYKIIWSSPLFVHHNVPFWLLSRMAEKIPQNQVADLFFLWARNWPKDKVLDLTNLAATFFGSMEMNWEDLVNLDKSLPGSVDVMPSQIIWKSGLSEIKRKTGNQWNL